ncbi:MAG: hypothetical protein ACXVXI_05155 [Mycobacteriaceae bacterium]
MTRPRTTRMLAVSGMLTLCATGVSVLGASSASAAPAVPAGPPDMVLNSCNTTAQAAPGQRVTLTAQALLAPITTDLNAIPIVGPVTLSLLTPVLTAVPLPMFTVEPTAVSPNSQQITGATIADQLVSSAKLLLPPGSEPQVRKSVGDGCKVDVTIVKPPAGATPSPESAVTRALMVSASGPAKPIASYGHVPRYTYGDLLAVMAGGAGFPVNVAPAPAPALPVPGTPGTGSLADQVSSSRGVSDVNEVSALPAPTASSGLPAQAVLAALVLALTTAALVRTWVLRRVAG